MISSAAGGGGGGATIGVPLTCKRRTMPRSAQPQHTNCWALRTWKRHQQEHRPQRPTESSNPTQHAKGRTGDCPGPRKEATTRRNVTQGGGGGGCSAAHYAASHMWSLLEAGNKYLAKRTNQAQLKGGLQKTNVVVQWMGAWLSCSSIQLTAKRGWGSESACRTSMRGWKGGGAVPCCTRAAVVLYSCWTDRLLSPTTPISTNSF